MFDWSNNSGSIDMKMGGPVFEGENLLTCWDSISLLHWIGALSLSLLLKYLQGLGAASFEPLVHHQNEFSLRRYDTIKT